MNAYKLVLRLAGCGFLVVSGLHLVLGPSAEVLLGAKIPPETLTDAVLDSQNRFYGVSFALFGVVMLLASTNLTKYKTVVSCVLWVLFAGGLSRLVSIAMVGMPSLWIITLAATEMISPVILALWRRRLDRLEHDPSGR